jgi:hypothetical protein
MMTKGISIHIGLDCVDPTQYEGWNGELTGLSISLRASVPRDEKRENRQICQVT